MSRKKRKQQQQAGGGGGGWKPVSVQFAGSGFGGGNDADGNYSNNYNNNHYDDPRQDDARAAVSSNDSRKYVYTVNDSNNKKKRPRRNNNNNNVMMMMNAERDLEAQPGEDVAMFYGLEVLDGSQYRVERNDDGVTHFIVLTENEEEEKDNDNDHDDDVMKPSKKKRRKDEKETPKSGKSLVNESAAAAAAAAAPSSSYHETNKATKKKRKKTKKSNNPSAAQHNQQDTSSTQKESAKKDDSSQQQQQQQQQQQEDENEAQIQSLQSSWCAATGGCLLHVHLAAALVKQNFWQPTPIQAAALAPSILGRRNIVGAAPTGSGKTLAFLLPIFQALLEQQQQQQQDVKNQKKEEDNGLDESDNNENDDDNDDDDDDSEDSSSPPLQALILTPTRELALQILSEGRKLVPSPHKKWMGCIVGGLAHAKQARVLDQDRPLVLVGTVGRLWELLSTRNHPHLNDLSQVRFLVIDEADRMIQQGSFPQLARILDAVQRANPMDDDDDNDDDDNNSNGEEGENLGNGDDDPQRLLGLPGVPGEARLQMLTDDILKRIEQQRRVEISEVKEVDDREYQDQEEELLNDQASLTDEEISLPSPPPVHRQTFVYSATLTLPSSVMSGKPSRKRKTEAANGVEGAIAEILEKSRAKGRTKVIDLSSTAKKSTLDKKKTKKKEKSEVSNTFRLPPGLRFQQIKCTQLHKDSHLYGYLTTTKDGGSGPCLVFCNSIAAVKRVGATLQTLGLQVRMLHANMQQRARLKVVESLRNSKNRVVCVSTDVAARGLDFPSVAIVVHYDVARNVDTFIHRSGRTARGIGEGAVGCSLSLVAPMEDRMHGQITSKLSVQFEKVLMDGRLLSGAQERVNLASKIVSVEKIQSQSQRDSAWFRENAKKIGVDLDDDMQDEGLAGGDHRDRDRLRQAQSAKLRLKTLLSQPLQTQRYGKFLSTNSAARSEISPAR